MDMQLIAQWKLVVSSSELRLIQKGLRGVLTPTEAPAALELQEKILRERERQAAQLATEASKAVINIEKGVE